MFQDDQQLIVTFGHLKQNTWIDIGDIDLDDPNLPKVLNKADD